MFHILTQMDIVVSLFFFVQVKKERFPLDKVFLQTNSNPLFHSNLTFNPFQLIASISINSAIFKQLCKQSFIVFLKTQLSTLFTYYMSLSKFFIKIFFFLSILLTILLFFFSFLFSY